MNRYLAEAVGAFGLVFAGTGSIVINDVYGGVITHLGIAATFGLIVAVMIYSLGNISGAHLNPAVTIGFCVARGFSAKEGGLYIVAQLSGAIIASATLKCLFPMDAVLGATVPSGTVLQSFMMEIILTFLLMFVILNVSTGTMEKGIMAGAAIGGTVALASIFAGPVSGASMNPARSIAPALISLHFEHLWIYIAAPVIGVLLAAPCCRLIQGEECCNT